MYAVTNLGRCSKESGPKGPGFGLPPEGASMVFPPCGSLLEWWSIENIKSQAPNYKQISNSNIQWPKQKTGLEFRILVIVICLIFVICNLEFLILQDSSTPKPLDMSTGKAIELWPSREDQVSMSNKI